jgi:hypothetical protein
MWCAGHPIRGYRFDFAAETQNRKQARNPTTSIHQVSALRCRAISMALTSLWPAVSSAANAQLFELEKPAFEVLTKTDAFELRSYQPMVLAELVMQSDVTTAGKEGSQMIKAYLFRQSAYKPVEVG